MASEFDVLIPKGAYVCIQDEVGASAGDSVRLQANEPGTLRTTEESTPPGIDKHFSYGTKRVATPENIDKQWDSVPAGGEKTYVRAIDVDNVVTVQTI